MKEGTKGGEPIEPEVQTSPRSPEAESSPRR